MTSQHMENDQAAAADPEAVAYNVNDQRVQLLGLEQSNHVVVEVEDASPKTDKGPLIHPAGWCTRFMKIATWTLLTMAIAYNTLVQIHDAHVHTVATLYGNVTTTEAPDTSTIPLGWGRFQRYTRHAPRPTAPSETNSHIVNALENLEEPWIDIFAIVDLLLELYFLKDEYDQYQELALVKSLPQATVRQQQTVMLYSLVPQFVLMAAHIILPFVCFCIGCNVVLEIAQWVLLGIYFLTCLLDPYVYYVLKKRYRVPNVRKTLFVSILCRFGFCKDEEPSPANLQPAQREHQMQEDHLDNQNQNAQNQVVEQDHPNQEGQRNQHDDLVQQDQQNHQAQQDNQNEQKQHHQRDHHNQEKQEQKPADHEQEGQQNGQDQ